MQKFITVKLLAFSIFALSSLSMFAQNGTKTVYMNGNDIYVRTCPQNFSSVPSKCTANVHPAFGTSSRKPITLNFLGSSKQFAELGKNVGESAADMYANLQRAYRAKPAHAKELDKIWRALGYSGFNDPSFTVASVSNKTEVPAGTVGMIGNAKHSYQWVKFGKPFYGFEIKSTSGCNIFIMQNCGNIFHSKNSGIYGFNSGCEDKILDCQPKCVPQTLTGTKTDSTTVSGQFSGSQDVIIMARNQGTKNHGAVLCIAKVKIPYAASYSMVVNGTAMATKTVSTCPKEQGDAIIPITLTLNKGLVKESKVSFGQDGRTYMDVNDKQFKMLGKVFSKCCPEDCPPVKK